MKTNASQPPFVWIIENDDSKRKPHENFYVCHAYDHGYDFTYFADHGQATAWCREKGLTYRTEWKAK